MKNKRRQEMNTQSTFNLSKLYENYPKMFSARFENIEQLKRFLELSKYLVAMGIVTETLGMNYKVFKALKRGG
jgi:phosphatidylserine/phosphatidylglycerophosphate/cardiolipin synthase-like enzyme